MGSGENFLEVGPGLDVRWLASPYLSVVIKETGYEHEMKGNYDDLGRGVGRVSCGDLVNLIFDLTDKGFERLIAVVGSAESLVIVLEPGGGNVTIFRIKMVQ